MQLYIACMYSTVPHTNVQHTYRSASSERCLHNESRFLRFLMVVLRPPAIEGEFCANSPVFLSDFLLRLQNSDIR